jgi:hypothetical protein
LVSFTFDDACFNSGTITPGTFTCASLIMATSVVLEIKTENGKMAFLGTMEPYDFGLGSVRPFDHLQPAFYFHGLDLLQANVAPARKNPRLCVHGVGVLRRDFVPRQFFATVMLPEVPDASRQTLPPRLIVDCESKSVRCRPRSRFGRVPFQGPDLLLSAYRRSVGAFFPPPVNPYRGASLPLFECEIADLITCACP